MNWLLARYYDRLMDQVEDACLRDWRAEVLGHARGDLLEIGAGTGANLAHYGDAVQRLVLAEPDRNMRALIPTAGRVEVIDAAAESLPFEANSFQTVVSTLVLCSVHSPAGALAELHRVLKPGGRLLFIEHVAAEARPDRYKWQRRVEPIWKRMMGNCHLTRHTGADIEAAGFEIEHLERASMRKAMPLVRPTIRGVARAV